MEASPKESHNFWHTFFLYPKMKFEGQWKDEQVILVLRAHPITQIPWIVNAVFLVILLGILNLLFGQYLRPGQSVFINFASVFFIFSYVFMNILRWAFNVGIVSDKRILDIDFLNLLYREVTASNHDMVSEVTARIGGFFGSIFQYGGVFIKTQGTEQNIEFNGIPRPSQVVKIINELIRPD